MTRRLSLLLIVMFSLGSIAVAQLTFFERLQTAAPNINPEVLRLALNADRCVRSRNLAKINILTVIDYSLPSTERRLWVFDLDYARLLYYELVAHGVNTGANQATEFSNRHGSRQSSLGVFTTGKTYNGKNGYSLKLHGLEREINHKALARTIVIHGAWYVTDDHGKRFGRLGRSWGCPALDPKVAQALIDTIKGSSVLFSYFPDSEWLGTSEYLSPCAYTRPATLDSQK